MQTTGKMMLAAAILSGVLLWNKAMATESPAYQVLSRDGKFELREYPALTVARTLMGNGNEFGRLFRYISGHNEDGQKIAMTTPVLIQHGGEKTGMSFIVPREVAATGRVPAPKDTMVGLDKFPGGRFAVFRFSGGRNERNEAQSLAALQEWMKNQRLTPTGDPFFAYYDPPWIPGFMRRNEVLQRLAVQP
jgi:hypothetical protein